MWFTSKETKTNSTTFKTYRRNHRKPQLVIISSVVITMSTQYLSLEIIIILNLRRSILYCPYLLPLFSKLEVHFFRKFCYVVISLSVLYEVTSFQHRNRQLLIINYEIFIFHNTMLFLCKSNLVSIFFIYALFMNSSPLPLIYIHSFLLDSKLVG